MEDEEANLNLTNGQKLTVKQEFKNLIPPSSEYKELEKKIQRERYNKNRPITVWFTNDEYVIIDGHNRHQICLEHKIPFTIEIEEFANEEEARKYMYTEQISRRNLDQLQRAYLIGVAYRTEKKALGTNQYTDTDKRVEGSLPPKKPKQSTAEKVGEILGVSHDTVKECEKFVKAVDKYAMNTGKEPNEIMYILMSGETKTTRTEVIDVANNYEKDEQIKTLELMESKKANSFKAAMGMVIRKRPKENGKEAKPNTEGTTEANEEKNEAGPDTEGLNVTVYTTEPQPTQQKNTITDFYKYVSEFVVANPENETAKLVANVLKFEEGKILSSADKEGALKALDESLSNFRNHFIMMINLSEEQIHDEESYKQESKPSYKVPNKIRDSIEQLGKKLKIKGFPKTISWLVDNKTLDMSLRYEKDKSDRITSTTFNKESVEKIKEYQETYDIDSIEEVLYRLVNSKSRK